MFKALFFVSLILFSNNVFSMINPEILEQAARTLRGEVPLRLENILRKESSPKKEGEVDSPVFVAAAFQDTACSPREISSLGQQHEEYRGDLNSSPQSDDCNDYTQESNLDLEERHARHQQKLEKRRFELLEIFKREKAKQIAAKNTKLIPRALGTELHDCNDYIQESNLDLEERHARHQQKLEKRRVELLEIFKREKAKQIAAKNAKLIPRALGTELHERDIKKLYMRTRRFYRGQMVAYKKGVGRYIYAKVSRVWRGKDGFCYGLRFSVRGFPERIVRVDRKRIFEIRGLKA